MSPSESKSLAKRIGVAVFGVAAYGFGVAALLAVIARTLGLTSFTGGPLAGLGTGAALAIDTALLFAFAAQHSIMARAWFKERWTRLVPPAAERSAYVLATGLALFPLLWLWQPAATPIWTVSNPAFAWAVRGLCLLGWSYLFLASFAIDHFHLFGLRQVYDYVRGEEGGAPKFKERLMYRFDRHPIMSGLLVAMWATPTMTLDHLLLAVGFTLYIIIGVHFEERALRRELGATYDDYTRRVGTIVPTFARSRTKTTDTRRDAQSSGLYLEREPS